MRLNQAVNEQALEEARQKIIEVYQGKGYNDVSVEFRVDPIDEKRGTARVVFTVTEGVKGAISQIRFEGNAHISEKVLRKQMKTRGRTLIYFMDKTGRLDEVQLEQDLDKIREYYQNHGFIDVEIKEVRKDRTPKGPMIITIVIAEGPQYHVRKLTISGYEHSTEARVRALLKTERGQRLFAETAPRRCQGRCRRIRQRRLRRSRDYTRGHAGRASAHRRALHYRRGRPLVCESGQY